MSDAFVASDGTPDGVSNALDGVLNAAYGDSNVDADSFAFLVGEAEFAESSAETWYNQQQDGVFGPNQVDDKTFQSFSLGWFTGFPYLHYLSGACKFICMKVAGADEISFATAAVTGAALAVAPPLWMTLDVIAGIGGSTAQAWSLLPNR